MSRHLKALPALALLLLLAYLPYLPVELPGVLPGRVNGPGSMQLLAICLTMAGIALSYDVGFGRTGTLLRQRRPQKPAPTKEPPGASLAFHDRELRATCVPF